MGQMHEARSDGNGMSRRALIGAVAAGAGGPVVARVATAHPGWLHAAPAAQDATPVATVEAYEFGFRPNMLTLMPGDAVALHSAGKFAHNFYIHGVDSVDVDIPTDGASITWTVPADMKPGDYTFYCAKPGHEAKGMSGKLTIVSSRAAPPGATPGSTPEATPGATPAAATLEAYEFGFRPNMLKLKAGELLDLSSTGKFPHNFSIHGADDIHVDIPTDGSHIGWTVPDSLKPGDYTFYCSKPGHEAQGMAGSLTITA